MNKEEIYDNQISPLMTQVIDICKKNNIAMLMSFSIPITEANNRLYTDQKDGDKKMKMDINPCEKWIGKRVKSKSGCFKGEATVILCGLLEPIVDVIHSVTRKEFVDIPIEDLIVLN